MLVAGEASGDLHGAELARSLLELEPGLALSGIGGAAMERAGVRLLHRAEDLAVVGFAEVLPKLGHIWRTLRDMKSYLARRRPELLILIDFPDFNFRLGRAARRLGIKVLYYVCPQVWAWRRGRARKMAGFVDRLACIFPFEPEFLAPLAPELRAEFVGHPLLDQPARSEGEGPWPVPEASTVVGLLPGSRRSELTRLLPVMLEAAGIMLEKRPELHFVLPLAPGLKRAQLEPFLTRAPGGLTVLPGQAAEVMARARVLLVASGTATLQAALAGTPMVVVYKTGTFNYLVARSLIKVEHIAMPNLVAGREVVPELIQGQVTPEALARQAAELLDDGGPRRRMLEGLAEVRRRMGGPGASRRVAQMALELMERGTS